MFYEHEKKERTEAYHGPRPSFPERDPRFYGEMKIYLEERNLNFNIAIQNGWYPTIAIDRFSRIVIPCSNPSGVVYYQARAMADGVKLRYRSPAATRADSIVYVVPFLRAKGAVIVEGPMDALAAAGSGWFGIGLMGNMPGPGVISYVASLVKHLGRVLVVPDSDCIEMGSYIIGALAMHYVSSAFITIPEGKDLAELSLKKRRELLR